jgi:hypothetical protein
MYQNLQVPPLEAVEKFSVCATKGSDTNSETGENALSIQETRPRLFEKHENKDLKLRTLLKEIISKTNKNSGFFNIDDSRLSHSKKGLTFTVSESPARMKSIPHCHRCGMDIFQEERRAWIPSGHAEDMGRKYIRKYIPPTIKTSILSKSFCDCQADNSQTFQNSHKRAKSLSRSPTKSSR